MSTFRDQSAYDQRHYANIHNRILLALFWIDTLWNQLICLQLPWDLRVEMITRIDWCKTLMNFFSGWLLMILDCSLLSVTIDTIFGFGIKNTNSWLRIVTNELLFLEDLVEFNLAILWNLINQIRLNFQLSQRNIKQIGKKIYYENNILLIKFLEKNRLIKGNMTR